MAPQTHNPVVHAMNTLFYFITTNISIATPQAAQLQLH
jgi:hypothetical protein